MKPVYMKELSYPDSLKLLNEATKRKDAIYGLVERGIYEEMESATSAVNKVLYETAQKTGASLYDLCFRTVPDVSSNLKKVDGGELQIEQSIRLIPVVFDLTHDGGYWKGKYFALKRKMKDLIESKDEEGLPTV